MRRLAGALLIAIPIAAFAAVALLTLSPAEQLKFIVMLASALAGAACLVGGVMLLSRR